MPCASQSVTAFPMESGCDRPWQFAAPAKCVPERMVSCAMTTGSAVAPCSGSIKKTAPFSVIIPVVSLHASKSKP